MRVTATGTSLTIAPGARGDMTVDVVNTGTVIDGVTARMVGLPAKSVTTRPTLLPLFPDAVGQITLTVDLPSTFPAGTHPMTVEVLSRQPEVAPEYVNVDMTVPLAPAVSITSRPETIRARRTGRFILAVTNRGNAPLDVAVAVEDAQQNCAVTVQPASFQLAAGQTVECVTTVRGRRVWMGTDTARRLIATASGRTTGIYDEVPGDTAADEESPRQVSAQTGLTFQQRPYLTRGLMTALILLSIIALWAAAFLFGLQKVFAGDPLGKAAPASFFAATPAADGGGATGGAGGVEGQPGAGTDGSGSTAGGPAGGVTNSGDGDAGPAGALSKSGTLPAGVGGAIAGTVTAASDGNPVGRILVTALRIKADDSTVETASAATQADGSYQVAGLFPGRYLLRFDAPGFFTSYYPAATTPSLAEPVTVTSGQVSSGSDAVMTGQSATITGKIDFGDVTEPLTAEVTARLLGASTDPRTIPPVTTDDEGGYTIPGLAAPGTYLLTVRAEGYDTATIEATVGGGAERFVSTAVLSAGSTRIEGTVTDGTEPLGGVTVSLTVGGQQVSTGTPTVGQVGHFVIDNLPTPATYIVTASKDGYGQVSQVIDLTPGSSAQELEIVLAPGSGVVEGTVVDQSGAGVGGAQVTVGGMANPPSTTTLTDGQVGSFRLEGVPAPGSYTLTVTAPGRAEQTVPVILASDEPLPPINIVMTPATGTITGTVAGADGAGLAGAMVTATDGQRSWPVVTTSAGAGGKVGSFVIAELPAGRYTVTATDPTGAMSQTTLVNLSSNKPESVSFTLTDGR